MSNVKVSKKKKYSKSSYDFVQFKRMIGKGLVKISSSVTIDKKALPTIINDVKDKILNSKNKFKSIGMTGLLNDGIIYVFKNYINMMAINAIPYSVIKKHNINLQVDVIQYRDLTKEELVLMVG